MSESNKHCCYSFNWSREHMNEGQQRPEDCPGVLATAFENGYPEDGYYIQVCPRTSWLGHTAAHIDFCGNGADVIILHQDAVPTDDEYKQAVRFVEENYA